MDKIKGGGGQKFLLLSTKGGGGVKKCQNSVHVVLEYPFKQIQNEIKLK